MKPRHKVPSKKQAGLKKISALEAFITFFISKKRLLEIATQSSSAKSHNHSSGQSYRIAIILDGKVYDILTAQESLAEIFLAQPRFELIAESSEIKPGDYISEALETDAK